MDNNNYVTIKTTIPLRKIIKLTIQENPETECKFFDIIAYKTTEFFLDKLNLQLNDILIKGGKRRTRTYRKTHLKRKTRKSSRTRKNKQKGGANPMYVVFFMSLFALFVRGIRTVSRADVKQQLRNAYEMKNIYINNYGTCTANTLLFLKSINLETFKDLSLQIMSEKRGLTDTALANYLQGMKPNSNISITTNWETTSLRLSGDDININVFINEIKKMIKRQRELYGNGDLLTAFMYHVKGQNNGHAVVLWITENDDIIIIDPQKFAPENRIVLYTSEEIPNRFMDDEPDLQLALESLSNYIKENIDITKETFIFMGMHIEVDTGIDNPDLVRRVISTIINAEMTQSRKTNYLRGSL